MPVRHCRAHDPGPALDAPCRHRGVRHRLPRQHDREPRPETDGRGAAAPDVDRHPRGTGLRRQRLPGRPGGAPDHRGRPRRPLRPAADLRHRPDLVRRDLGPVRARADPRVHDRGAAPPGCRRGAARSRLAGDHHRRVHRRGPGPGVRAVGGVDVRADPARPDHRRPPRRQPDLAAGVPHQRPPRRGRPVRGDPPRRGVARSRRERPLRLARLDRRRARGRRAGLRGDPRPGDPLVGPGRLDLAGGRRRLPRRLPDPDGDHAAPARAAVAVPEPRVRVDQPRDVPDLRRALRLVHVHRPALPGDARLHGDGRGDHRPPGGDPAGDAVRPDRGADRPVRGADVPRRGPADRGRRAALARPDPGDRPSRGRRSSATPRP